MAPLFVPDCHFERAAKGCESGRREILYTLNVGQKHVVEDFSSYLARNDNPGYYFAALIVAVTLPHSSISSP
jgi:hypothetical protein